MKTEVPGIYVCSCHMTGFSVELVRSDQDTLLLNPELWYPYKYSPVRIFRFYMRGVKGHDYRPGKWELIKNNSREWQSMDTSCGYEKELTHQESKSMLSWAEVRRETDHNNLQEFWRCHNELDF